jgi:4-aminobutyrate aminotransferase-like enzyme
METPTRRTARIFILALALTVGLLIGGVLGRVTASSGPGAAESTTEPDQVSTTVSNSGLTSAEQDQLAHQIQMVGSHTMQRWERGCSSDAHPSANVC